MSTVRPGTLLNHTSSTRQSELQLNRVLKRWNNFSQVQSIMASKLLMLCLFTSILIYNLQYQSTDTRRKPHSDPASKDLDLKPGITKQRNTRNGATALRRKRDLTGTGAKSDLVPASKKLDLKSEQKENRKKLLEAYSEFEAEINEQITSIIKTLHKENECEYGTNMDGTCKKKPETSSQVLDEGSPIADSLLKRIGNVHEILLALIPLATSSLETNRSSAHVPRPIVWSNLNDSVHFSCDSEGKALSFCLWERKSEGPTKMVLIDDDGVIENEGKTGGDGISYKGNGLSTGDCGLEIERVELDDIGKWQCTLVTQGGETLAGVTSAREIPIYFATIGNGIKAYSPKTERVTTIINTNDNVIGVAYDTMRNYIYWNCYFCGPSNSSAIYRFNVDGDGAAEMLLNASKYGFLRSMEFDWIAQNLYVVSDGHILACDGRVNRRFHCATVLSRQGQLSGIALNPNQGTMYWTNHTSRYSASIVRSGMDGRKPTAIVENLRRPAGVTIDLHGARLYWTDNGLRRIQSSDLDGGGVVNVAEVSSKPYGISLLGQRLCWSLVFSKKLQSSNKDGTNVRTLYTGTAIIRHLAVPDWTLPRNRTNPCGEQTCPGVCVLTPIYYRCL